MTNVNTRLLLVCEEAFKTKTLLQLTENTKHPQLKHPPQHFSSPRAEPLGTTLTTAHQCQTDSHTVQRHGSNKHKGKKSERPKLASTVRCWEFLKVNTWPLFLKITRGLAIGLNWANSIKLIRLKGNLVAAF